MLCSTLHRQKSFKLKHISYKIQTVLDLGTTTLHNFAAVPRRARVKGPQTFVSLNFRLETIQEEKKDV